jgi:hypothetical protein
MEPLFILAGVGLLFCISGATTVYLIATRDISMIDFRVALNNLLHSLGLARWRMETQTSMVVLPGDADFTKIEVAGIVVSDDERAARLETPAT